MFFGRPVPRSRPRTSLSSSSGSGIAEPIASFSFSEVCWPIATECTRFMYVVIASSKS